MRSEGTTVMLQGSALGAVVDVLEEKETHRQDDWWITGPVAVLLGKVSPHLKPVARCVQRQIEAVDDPRD